jgi:hypothetical protein
MIQIPFAETPLPPGFIPPPLDWFQFAMIYVVGLELVLLAMPNRWRDKVIEVAFCLLNKPMTGTIKE